MDQETKDFFVAQLRQLSADIDAKMDSRFDAQTKSFDAKLGEMESRFDAKLDARFDAQTKSFDTKLAKMESRFDAKMDARLEDIVGVIQDLSVMVSSKIDGLDARVEALEDDAKVTRDILLRMEGGLKEKVDIQSDRIQVAFHRIERVEDHLHLEHSLVCEKTKKKYVPGKK